MARYRIRNWTKFQHYKDRNPPWIKLHVEIFGSEDWVMLDDASKLLALVCMVVAAKHDGFVPDNPAYIKRVSYLNKTPNLKPLIECGFLEIALADDSERKQTIAPARPEKEAEQRQSRKKTSLRSVTHAPKKSPAADPEGFEAFWLEYPRKIAKPKARKAYIAALAKSSAPALVDGARRYRLERAGEDETYTAHPTTWLNAERWNDPEKAPHNGSRPDNSRKPTPHDRAIRALADIAGIDTERSGECGNDAGIVDQEPRQLALVVDRTARENPQACHASGDQRTPGEAHPALLATGHDGRADALAIPRFLLRS